MFEGWVNIEIHQIKNPLPKFLKPEYGDSHNIRDPIVWAHAMRNFIVSWCNVCDFIFIY